ncbi:hypothetical protein A7X67_14995 [Clostridium sp. W14A]|uniref:TetR/AcrR family transcriptional regulator C-terminal domain-containing protein n=1 Tax=Caproicibacter fermentans TaxID=2576756 RepID=A0A7G8TCH2_9FIRM|nr:TetR/AcrR family transcriptional regulator C-terminal domain-containing protein [Caproicibacter fermentans]OCN02418.1 hypothetical protein A7X67_14995 [Clostridium sp. W14A]QNK41313.1 TetR/AcrR family transcriptional regulator C-terminal domain-containing protein [Caproicibacter fermentans]
MERMTHTKQLLASSLKDLMKTTPFRKITVQNVTDHCGLNRQTFYYHFKDIYQLLEWIYQNEIFKQVNGVNRYSWKNALIDVLRYSRQNKAFLRNINRSLRKETVEKFLYPILYRWIGMIYEDACYGLSVNPEEKQFLLDFFTNAFVSFIIRWIGNGMQESEEELLKKAEWIKEMFLGMAVMHTAPEQFTDSSGLPVFDFTRRCSAAMQAEIY